MSKFGNRMQIAAYVNEGVYSLLENKRGKESMSSFVSGILGRFVEENV